MKKSNIIEPCCINGQLPEVMGDRRHGVFFSNGDWGVKQLMGAISYMVEEHATVVLLMPSVDVYFCRMIREWLGRGWMDCLILGTKEDCGELIKAEFAGYEDKVTYCYRKNLHTEAFIRYNDHQRLAVFGAMRMEGNYEFCQYSYSRNESQEEWDLMMKTIRSLFVKVRKNDGSIR